MTISELLIKWYVDNRRDLPWRRTSDPYRIWLSEIMLQQTRVNQALPYYERFTEAFPTLDDMANASERDILELWQGLGYYSRARNMLHTAQHIQSELHRTFPSTYASILELKGVGRYTAAAIASFAFNLPHPVVDGNVMRVISRLFNIIQPVDRTAGRSEIDTALKSIFPSDQPAIFNQAIMEIGSLICTPKSPLCSQCPLHTHCLSRAANNHLNLPTKTAKITIKEVQHHYLVVLFGTKTYIEKRTQGIWKNLYQFPLSDTADFSTLFATPPTATVQLTYSTTHLLSHRKIVANFYTIQLHQKPKFLKSDIFEIQLNDLGSKYPISKLIHKYLENKEAHDQ